MGLLGSYYLATLNLAMLGEGGLAPAEAPASSFLEGQKESHRSDSHAQSHTGGQ